jgi:hypothetical protein
MVQYEQKSLDNTVSPQKHKNHQKRKSFDSNLLRSSALPTVPKSVKRPAKIAYNAFNKKEVI